MVELVLHEGLQSEKTNRKLDERQNNIKTTLPHKGKGFYVLSNIVYQQYRKQCGCTYVRSTHIYASWLTYVNIILRNFKIYSKKLLGKIRAFISNLGTEIRTSKNETDSEII